MIPLKKLPAVEGRGGLFGGGQQQQQQQQQPSAPPPPTRTPDTLRSTDHVEFVLSLGEGPWKGLVDHDAKNFYVGDTPLVSADGNLNFNNFGLEFYAGDGINNTVLLTQTGAAISHNVNVAFSHNTPVVRQGTVTASATTVTTLPTSGTYIGKVYYIAGDGYWLWTENGWSRTNDPFVNFLQIRLVVGQLYKENDTGTFEWDAELKIEVKRSDQPDSAYVPAFYRTATGGNAVRGIGGGVASSGAGAEGNVIDTLLIHGKTMSNYAKVLRIPVQNSSVPYTIRITQLTPPISQATNESAYARITWESFQEITSNALRLDGVAFIHGIGQSSDQFSSLPDLYGIFDTMIVRVPTNYNEVTRVYTGLWDGTWKLAYTNNPMWCLYELVVNDDWGMSSFTPISMDKYDAYEAAQWCDEMVSDGKGGLQPRYTLNLEIKEPRSAKETARYIAGSFNAVFFDDGNGTAHIKVDKDDPAIHLITQENVIDGLIEYSHTDLAARFNFITVTFLNEELTLNEDRRVLTLPDHIAEFGMIPTEMIAVGCIDPQEALRRAQYKLLTGTTETKLARFKVNRTGLFMKPFQVILIADPDLGYGLSGRLKTLDPARINATLRDPVYLEAGIAYKATFQVPNPSYPDNSSDEFQIIERTLVNASSGLRTTLQFNSALPEDIAELATFSITQVNGEGIGAPKPFRLINIEVIDDNPDHVQVEAIEVNRNKFYDIDNITSSGVIQYSNLSVRTIAAPATMDVTPTFNGDRADLLIEWERVTGAVVRGYELSYSFNGGAPQPLSSDSGLNYNFVNVPLGSYVFYVRAVGMNDNRSPYTSYRIDLTDPDVVNPSGVAGVSNIRYETGRWTGRSVNMIWDASRPVGFSHYQVRVRHATTNAILRTETAATEMFLYTEEMNIADHGGVASRDVTFEVTVITRNLDISAEPQTSSSTAYTAHNSPPAMPGAVTSSWVDGGLRIAFTPVTDTDFVGTLVWVRLDHTWNSSQTPTHILAGNPIVVPGLDRTQTYYIHLAHYDSFGQVGLNHSNEYTISAGVPNAPTAPGLAGNRRRVGEQSARTDLTASWTPSTTPELVDHYVVNLRTGPTAAWEQYVVPPSSSWSTTRFFAPYNDAYQFRVQAVSAASIASAWSDIVNCVFTDDLTAPGVPTGLSVLGTYNMVFASWANPVDDDFKHVEVFVSANTTRAPEPTAIIENGQYFVNSVPTGQSRYFWLRSVDFSGNKSALVGPQFATALAVPNLDTVPGAPGQVVGLVLNSASTMQNDGTIETVIAAGWTPRTEADLLHYEWQIKEGAAGVVVSGFTDQPGMQWFVKANTTYYVKVRAIDAGTNKGLFSTEVSHTTVRDTTVPGGVTALSVTPGFQNLFLNWVNPSDRDFDYVEIWESATNDRNTATKVATTATDTYTKQNLTAGSTRYYWLRAVDTSENVSSWSSGQTAGASGTTLNINSSTQIANGVITTPHIIVGTLHGDRLQIGTLDANRIAANSIISDTIQVGTGLNLASISYYAQVGAVDPVARINAGSTLIDPGKIVISGATTLASWRNGGDLTKIEGGSIAANTISANQIQIGVRGLTISGLEFSINTATNTLSWTAGNIQYIDDNGTIATQAISAASTVWSSGTRYVYWTRGQGTLFATTSLTTAVGANSVPLATYRGGLDLVANYGRTIIDGAQITTGSITANQLSTGQLLTQSAQIANAIINSAHISTIHAGQITSGTINTGTITFLNSRMVIDADNQNMVVRDVNNTIRVMLGHQGGGAYGLRLFNASGTLIFDQNGVNGAMVTGLGTLAYANTADWSQLVNVPAFGGMAFLNGITGANISTYIASGAIGTAYISDAAITAAKIGSVNASTITTGILSAARIDTQSITTEKLTIGGVTTDRLAIGAVTNAASFYRVLDIYDGTPGTSLGSVTITTTGQGIVNLLGFMQFVYTNVRDIYAVTSLS